MAVLGYGLRRRFQPLTVKTFPAPVTETVVTPPATGTLGQFNFSLAIQSALIALLEDI